MKKLKLGDGLELPLAFATEKFGILGQSGAGKTYTAMRLAELAIEAGIQTVALDPVGCWWGLRSSADGKRAGLAVLVVGGDHGQLPLSASAGAATARLVVDRRVSAVVDVSELEPLDKALFVRDFVAALFELKKKHPSALHLIMEEAQEFVPQDPEGKEEARMRSSCVRLLKIGRNYGIGWTLVSQEPQAVSKRALDQVGTMLAMRTMGDHAQGVISGWAKSKLRSKEALEQLKIDLPELGTGEMFLASPFFLKTTGRFKTSRKVTFDSSRTPEVGESLQQPKVLADVDVEQLRAEFAGLVEQIEHDDPEALRRTIKQLQAELAKKPAAAPAAAPAKVITHNVPVQVVDAKVAAALERSLAKVQEVANTVRSMLVDAEEISQRIHGDLARAQKFEATPIDRKIRALASGGRAAPGPKTTTTPRAVPEGSKQPTGEAAVLTAIAQHPQGVTPAQLAILTGYKKSSRNKYLQKLRAAGHIEGAEKITATAAGIASLGSFQPLPTGDDLRAHWLARLPDGERVLLEAIVAEYPGSVGRDELDTVTDYKKSSRNKYLQHLAARGLITAPEAGVVRASDDLFDHRRTAVGA